MTRGVRKDTGKSANWKGGKTVTSHGYVLVWVGKDHPLADVRGYAYEHRLVAAQTEGAAAIEGKHVHHGDDDKHNNAATNLTTLTPAEHRLEHRDPGSVLRLPGEANEMLKCACGCGRELLKYDPQGRPREYLSGHNPRFAPTVTAILAALEAGPKSRQTLATELGLAPRTLAVALSKLKRQGKVQSVSHGCWRKAK